MKRGFSRRGQPLIALILLLGGWVSARAMMWDSATISALPYAPPTARTVLVASAAEERVEKFTQRALVSSRLHLDAPGQQIYRLNAPRRYAAAVSDPLISLPPPAPVHVIPQWFPSPISTQAARGASGHQMLWMAALAQIGSPLDQMRFQPTSGFTESRFSNSKLPIQSDAKLSVPRWSADGWLLWRRDGQSPAAGGVLTPSYGASQAGVILRYRLVPGSDFKPSAYLRTSSSLNGSAEREAALGFSLRPFGRLPLAIAGEARFTSLPGRNILRPAAFAVTELSPFRLPMGLRGEAYGQAGYVGGAFATGFADGQLRVDRRVTPLGKGELRLGAGLWGGAQKGASRLDAGPTLTISRPVGGTAAMRLAADWRFRVAGKAAPGSGPALTLSAGF